MMFLTLIIPAILSVLSPILIANTITAITVYDFNRAIHQTILEFIIVATSSLSYFFYHLISRRVNKIIITNFQTYIYHTVKNNKDLNGINVSILKDISTCVTFNKNIIYKSCFFIKSIIILVIIFTYSYILSLIIIAVSIISFFFLKITDKKIQFKTKELNTYETASVDLFNSICNGDNAEQNYNLEQALKDKYFKYVESNIKTTNSISLYYSINNNFISLILKSAVFASTIFLINCVMTTQLTLSVYLILTPYLTSSAENLISFFDVFSEIALMNNILSHFKSLKYTSTPKEEQPISIDSYNLYLYNVSLDNKFKLENINLKIKHKECVCFVSDDDEKLKTFSNVLNKKIKVSSGCVFLGDKNISDLNTPDFNKAIMNISLNEQFFNISIYENFYMVCPSRNKILKEIKNMGLQDFINNFENKFNTIMHDNFTQKDKFLLGLARAYLAGAKILNIYKLPENLSKKDNELIIKMIKHLKKDCTIICFFNSLKFKELFDNIYYLENLTESMNKLSKIADNKNRK